MRLVERNPDFHRACHCIDDLVADLVHRAYVCAKPFAPYDAAVLRVAELDRNGHGLAGYLDKPGEAVLDVEFAPHLVELCVAPAKEE